MACITSSSAALSIQSLPSTNSLPTYSNHSIQPNSLSWGSSFITSNISINNKPSFLNKNSLNQAAWTRRSRGELAKKGQTCIWDSSLLNEFFSRKFIQAKVMHSGTSKVRSVATTVPRI